MIRINGTIFYSYQVCARQAWFYAHRINPDPHHPLLELGRLVHQYHYTRERKEIFVDNLLKIDLIKDELIAELKKSSRHRKAARLQLAFYLYYLKKHYQLSLKGILLFPTERRSEKVELTPELEAKIEQLLHEMEQTLNTPKPPPPQWISYCRSCSFQELCWS